MESMEGSGMRAVTGIWVDSGGLWLCLSVVGIGHWELVVWNSCWCVFWV